MAIDTIPTLIDALRESRLLNSDQLREIEGLDTGNFSQPGDLASDLISRCWLTRYQAKQILRGLGSFLILGAYRILELLGKGGMGNVYKALHQPMNRIVALKVVKPELLADPRMLKRFHREVQIVSGLSHPNIVTVFDAAQIGNIHYLAMEFIDGANLTALVRDRGPLPVAVACDYIRQ